MVLEYLEAIRTTVQLLKDGRSIYRDWKATRGDAPDELERKLEEAQEQLKLAEVAAATELGYPLCRRHWPPGIMVDLPRLERDDALIDQKRCLSCDVVVEWRTRRAPREIRSRL